MDYLNLYTAPDDDEKFIENHERGKARKIVSILEHETPLPKKRSKK